ncbi:MAG: hypothetical protein GAK28_02040 [Luteibacter sp.]|nr:MAG: hypothetical protein GAK28_02040 [Luteibacter sp.]
MDGNKALFPMIFTQSVESERKSILMIAKTRLGLEEIDSSDGISFRVKYPDHPNMIHFFRKLVLVVHDKHRITQFTRGIDQAA